VQGVRREFPELQGVFIGGSCATRADMLVKRDVDLRGLMSTDAMPKEAVLRQSRYGVRVHIPTFPRLEQVEIEGQDRLVEWILLPWSSLANERRLLGSHWPFASGSAIAHGTILLDTNGMLEGLSRRIAREYTRSGWLRQRMVNNTALCLKKLDEYLKEPPDSQGTIAELWNGPLWALMGAGTTVLSLGLRPPTFRFHLLRVREVALEMRLMATYEAILEAWGFSSIDSETAGHFAGLAKKIYGDLTADGTTRSLTVSPLKCAYYAEALDYMVERGRSRESLFTSLFLLCHCAIVSHQDNESYAHEACRALLRQMGMFSAIPDEDVVERSRAILNQAISDCLMRIAVDEPQIRH